MPSYLSNKIPYYASLQLGRKTIKPIAVLGSKSMSVIKNVTNQQLENTKKDDPVSDLEKTIINH